MDDLTDKPKPNTKKRFKNAQCGSVISNKKSKKNKKSTSKDSIKLKKKRLGKKIHSKEEKVYLLKKELEELNELRSNREALVALEKVCEGDSKLVKEEDLAKAAKSVREEIQEEKEYLWRPQKCFQCEGTGRQIDDVVCERCHGSGEGIQEIFLKAYEDEVLFSGGRGSGKSDCLIIDPLRYCDNKNFRGLLIRRTMPELRELINRAKDLYPKVFPGTKWREQEKLFLFPSGAKIEFGYCDKEDDLERYRGQQYTWLGIDEITQFDSPDIIDKLKASLRSTDPSLPIHIRCTTNPSGRGVNWVRERWVDKGAANETIINKYTTSMGELKTTRKWLHSIPEDNQILLKNNPQYLASLHSIDNELLRRQWLYGDWTAVEGLAFDEFRRETHVIKPFEVPRNWHRFRACDWGYGALAVVLWFAVDYDNNLYVYRELAVNGPKASPQDKLRADGFALKVLELEQDEYIRYGVLDSSVWHNRGEAGETVADTMLRLGCNWYPSDRSKGSRAADKIKIHQYLAINPDTGKPRVFIFNTCTQLIKELSSLPLDPNNPEDVDTKAEDHAYDAFRYGIQTRPDFVNSLSWGDMAIEEGPIIVNTTIGF